jgi:hypothetical protein
LNSHDLPGHPSFRYWIDIFFNDQNTTDMPGVLSVAERRYRRAQFHYALMLNDPFSRGWCLFEMMIRILAGMRALDLARPEDIVPLILMRDSRFTRLVIVEGLTNVYNDVTGRKYNRFGQMATFDSVERDMIQRRIIKACRSSATFNMLLSCYRSAAIQNFRQVRWRRREPTVTRAGTTSTAHRRPKARQHRAPMGGAAVLWGRGSARSVSSDAPRWLAGAGRRTGETWMPWRRLGRG